MTPVRDRADSAGVNLDEGEAEAKHIGPLLGAYGFSITMGDRSTALDIGGMISDHGVIKKRKIEPVNGLPRASKMEESPRSKSPKKKPQTITEKATAPFVECEMPSERSLRQYFEERASIQTKANTSPRRETPASSNKRVQAKKKAVNNKASQPPVLHSPETAMQKAKDQDFLFGTSSQLARDESPTFSRDLQQAMKESEIVEQQQSESSKDMDDFLDISTTIKRAPRSLALTPSKNLWSAAARDFDVALLDAEVLDLTKTPVPAKLATRAPKSQKSSIIEATSSPKIAYTQKRAASIGELPSPAPEDT